jgi:acyl carrier protein
MREDVMSQLREILARDLQVPEEAIHEDAHLRADLKLDSLSLVDLAHLTQKDFGFKASAEEFRGSRTVGALADFVVSKSAKPSP